MNRLRELDLLRATGTIIILLHHLPDYTGNFYDLRYFGLHGNLSYVNVVNTYIGLSIFTFVSGMALSHAYPYVEHVGSFLQKRWLRLFPLYWLALPMFALTDIKSDIAGTAIHILGLQIALAPRLVKPLPTLWFVGLVMLLYPFYASIACRKRTGREIALAALTIFIAALLVRITFDIIEYRFFVYFPVFVAGVLWRRSGMYRRHRLRPIPALLAVLIFVLSVFAFRYARRSEISGEIGRDFIVRAAWSEIVSTFVSSNLMMFSFLYLAYPLARAAIEYFEKDWRRVVNLISWSSYGIYLFHRPVLAALTATLDASTIARPWRLAVIALPGVVLTTTLACAVQYLHDRLTRRLLARRKQ